ncbi:MAG: lysophospholipid transporter LplT [Gammaproteobacteria bacterium]|uniref:lysophospholipid transporter LplT n=1 Tax=Limnobacter sp. TaxID=2003368 RepID=UPI001DF9F841|nr:lysophospholipid transporter LplT [Limnobacter sp.]MBU0783420.1 lysophospholipid transporter LplT [Gammaproteobacteria bacterium]MBU0850639.1 lysophospholipid transporter LplT [Gammaproteobacteria bacterium]MBU1267770.1 lysophospholipid transporter LplT [Gammaproteobacteria bacterium]MBU1529627.1 lysophospholipid transporter LplT [Gammaproteobacteria bacterium]MBU1780651.1 lysophospholipid transporter LplT [Gammaproteobacteria bacterium]
MKPGFYTIMAAQFFSSLADNALLIAAIALLFQIQSPDWMTPLLKLFFVVSYVVLAPFVGGFADTLPKGKVMLITNSIKVVGCLMMFFGVHPLLSYAVVGLGAAAYSPAKYGILTELLPHDRLVEANGWIEGLTVLSIIIGTVLGGILIAPGTSEYLMQLHIPGVTDNMDTPAEAAIFVITSGYLIAAIFNFKIPDTGARYEPQLNHPIIMTRKFYGCVKQLWSDKLGQISLAVTTLFWGAGATLQFIVLKWAESALGLPLDKSAILQGVCAFGVAAGAVAAAKLIPLKKSMLVLPMGILMGLVCMAMVLVNNQGMAYLLITVIGALSGFFVVPMNALLQHRGHVLMSAGRSIAIQNFNENISVLTMLAVYAVLISFDVHVNTVILMFGGFVMATMFMVILWHRRNQRLYDVEARIGEDRPVGMPL